MPASDEEKLFRDIGEFIYHFSQLEFTLRWTLGGSLGLKSQHVFDAVTASYDFAKLCGVAEQALMDVSSDERPPEGDIRRVIKECRGINDERVKIVHGTWQLRKGLTYVSRSQLQETLHYASPNDLPRLIERTKVATGKVMDLYVLYTPPKRT